MKKLRNKGKKLRVTRKSKIDFAVTAKERFVIERYAKKTGLTTRKYARERALQKQFVRKPEEIETSLLFLLNNLITWLRFSVDLSTEDIINELIRIKNQIKDDGACIHH